MKKKKIFILASWLEIDNSFVGSFFIEQADVLKNEFDMCLGKIQRKNLSKIEFIKEAFKPKISEHIVSEMPVYFLLYPQCDAMPIKVNNFIYNFHIKHFIKTLQRENIDLIHAQSIFQAGIHANHINNLAGIPFIFTEHNQITFIDRSASDIAAFRNLIRKPYPKLIVSKDKIRQFAANGIFANFQNVGNLVNEDIFNNKDNRKQNADFVMTTIGAFVPIKDHDTMLQALSIIDKIVNKKIIFRWIGINGWGHNANKAVEEFLKKYFLKNIEIEVIPLADREKIAEYLNQSDLFLFSSISEGMPVSVLESLCCGTPVCATNCGGVDEVINEINGKIVPIKGYKEMADFVLKVINKEIKFNHQLISEIAIEKFGKPAFRKKMSKIYSETIQSFQS